MIEVINGNVEKAFRDLARTLQVNGTISEVKNRGHFIKPSEARSLKKAKRLINIRKYALPKSQKKASRYSVSIFSPTIL